MEVALNQLVMFQKNSMNQGDSLPSSEMSKEDAKSFISFLSNLQSIQDETSDNQDDLAMLEKWLGQLKEVIDGMDSPDETTLEELTGTLSQLANLLGEQKIDSSFHSEESMASLFHTQSISISEVLEAVNSKKDVKQQLLSLTEDLYKVVEKMSNPEGTDSKLLKNELQTALVKITSYLSQLGNTIQNGQASAQAANQTRQANRLMQNMNPAMLKENLRASDMKTAGKQDNSTFLAQVNQGKQTNTSEISPNRIHSLLHSKAQVAQTSSSDLSHLKSGQPLSIDSMPMSKIEQYTIYLQRGEGNPSSNNSDVMEQIQKILKSSRFIQNEGSTQLTIKLKPAHLGDMVVKFTQTNGEMAVRIAVSSQAAKDMLESNMNQLRHMFHPHQVIVDKQAEPTIPQQSASYFNFNQNEEEKERNDHSYREQMEQENDTDEESEEKSFEDYLTQIET
ncbi:hook-length control protein FliK [Salinibacillus kushneri]|uniref:Hook-length control protein FliK n=1 Tax=Salinibacillus kushneri TaxID=237682 RepID=A0A1I0E9J4_9BACI|nr:flagellar hook-length control protein FliK [Salinibacillus kushneri]SET41732.1 hook-length control protein FliK [Salinibacillus kushneri]